MSTSLQPLSAKNRDVSLDILRGFALAGVLLTFCAGDIGSSPGHINSFLDDLVAWSKWILVEGRMYTMLILIFGIGFHVQLEKAKQHRTSLVPVFMRRLAGLIVLGFIHAILLSTRDILMFYGIAGIALLLVRNSSSRQLVVYLVILLLILITPILNIVFKNPWPDTQSLVQPNNYRDHVQYNWQFFKVYHRVYYIYFDMLFHFMLGFWISKSGLLQKLKYNKKFRRNLLCISLASSFILIPVYYFGIEAYVDPGVYKLGNHLKQFLVISGIFTIWQLWMMVCVTLYATILIGVSISEKRKGRFHPLAAFGQMALSNYLIQSILLVPYLLAFDKYNNLAPFNGFILFLMVLGLQILFSTWWMKRFTMGPFEWLLRSFTYWKWQQIKKSGPAEARVKTFSLIKNLN